MVCSAQSMTEANVEIEPQLLGCASYEFVPDRRLYLSQTLRLKSGSETHDIRFQNMLPVKDAAELRTDDQDHSRQCAGTRHAAYPQRSSCKASHRQQ